MPQEVGLSSAEEDPQTTPGEVQPRLKGSQGELLTEASLAVSTPMGSFGAQVRSLTGEEPQFLSRK